MSKKLTYEFVKSRFEEAGCMLVSTEYKDAHHINSYSRFTELRTTLSNGVTLCKCCHKEFHSLYGKVRFTAEDFEEFMLINTDTLPNNGDELHQEIED